MRRDFLSIIIGTPDVQVRPSDMTGLWHGHVNVAMQSDVHFLKSFLKQILGKKNINK